MTEQESTRKPYWPVCGTSGCVGIRWDDQEMCLAHVDSEIRRNILAALKPGANLDLRGTPIDPELLSELLAALRPDDGPPTLGHAEFNEAQFTSDVDFSGAQFSGPVWFTAVEFNGHAVFDRAQFNGGAGFSQTQFAEEAKFGDALFNGTVLFTAARFAGNAWFHGAQFNGHVVFDQAKFKWHSAFNEAQFNMRAAFRGARFLQDSEFDMAQFKRAGIFGPVLARSILSFKRATFEQKITIEAVGPRLSCVGTRFVEGATLRLRRVEVALDGAVFGQPSTVVFAPDSMGLYDPDYGYDPDPEPDPEVETFGEDPGARGEGGGPPRPRLMSLRGVDAATLTLSDLDLAACLFQGAHRLDQLRIEGARPFADTPGAWQLQLGRWRVPVWRRWSRRQTLAEEHHWHAEPSPPRLAQWLWLSRSAWHGPACQIPGWVAEETKEPIHRLTPDRLAVLYRGLRKAQEDSKNEPGAADFYYGEMEMRRLDRHVPWAERVIVWLYWLVSGYGLRGLRALASLAVVVVGVAALLHVVGYTTHPSPQSFWGSLLYAASSTLSIGDEQARLSGWGKLLRITLRLAGPVLLGLTVLSIRNRVKR